MFQFLHIRTTNIHRQPERWPSQLVLDTWDPMWHQEPEMNINMCCKDLSWHEVTTSHMLLILLHRPLHFVFLPLVVSLSRARNVPLWFPWDSRIRSASLRPILPKYHLAEEKQSDSSVGPPSSPAARGHCSLCQFKVSATTANQRKWRVSAQWRLLRSRVIKTPYTVHWQQRQAVCMRWRKRNTNTLFSFASSFFHFAWSRCCDPSSAPLTGSLILSTTAETHCCLWHNATGLSVQSEQTGSNSGTGPEKRWNLDWLSEEEASMWIPSQQKGFVRRNWKKVSPVIVKHWKSKSENDT